MKYRKTAILCFVVVVSIGWFFFSKERDFNYCVPPNQLFISHVSVDEQGISLRGGTTNSIGFYDSNKIKVEGNAVYLGIKYTPFKIFSTKSDQFDIRETMDTQKIKVVYLKGGDETFRNLEYRRRG